MDQIELAEFAKNSENKEGSDFTKEVQEAGIAQGSLIVSRLYNTMLGSITRVMRSWSAELTKVLTEAGLTPTALSEEQLYTALITLIDKHSYGCQMGDLIPNIGTVSPLGRVLCNGQRLVDCKTIFPDFYNYVVNNTPYKTLAEWNSQKTIYGQCGFCAVDGDDVIVPLITRPISGVSNLNETGQAVLDTMRPITGVVGDWNKWIMDFRDTQSGPFYREELGNARGPKSGSSDPYVRIKFDTGRLGARYNGSETRGKQVQYPYYIQVFSAASQSMANVTELIDMLKYQNQVGITTITATSGAVTLKSGGIYTMTIAGNTVFQLPTPEDPSLLNQILLQLRISVASTVDWGTTKYFTASPNTDVGYYNIIWEYDAIQGSWIVGQLTKLD